MTLHIKISHFFIRLNLSENETKSNIFAWVMFKSDIISFLSIYINLFHRHSKLVYFTCKAKVSLNNGCETKLGIFLLDIFTWYPSMTVMIFIDQFRFKSKQT